MEFFNPPTKTKDGLFNMCNHKSTSQNDVKWNRLVERKQKMKKLVLAVGTLVALASCSFNPFVSSTPSTVDSGSLVLNEDYALKTAAAASLLTDALSGSTGGTLSARKDRRLTESEELEAIDKVHQYLGVMNQILTDQPIQTELVESDREAYTFKSIVTVIGLDGTTSVFTLYFNGVVEEEPTSSSSEVTSSEVTSEESSVESSIEESSVSSEVVDESSSTEVIEDPQARDDDEEDDTEEIDEEYENEDEENDDVTDEDRDEYENYESLDLGDETDEGEITALVGLAVVGELEYQLVGFTKTEGDEIQTKYFLWLDESNWIRIATETETDESKYKIVMKVNDDVSKMMFKIEQEDGQTEVKLFIKSDNRAPEMYKFSSELHEETGGQLIRIHARVDREKFKAVVLIYTDENGDVIYNYRFEGSTRDYDRSGGRDYHDRDSRGNGR